MENELPLYVKLLNNTTKTEIKRETFTKKMKRSPDVWHKLTTRAYGNLTDTY